MITISPLVLWVFSELLLIFMVISLGFVVAGSIRKRNERRAITRLIGRIKEDQARRRGETRALMQTNYGFNGEELDSIVLKISREEKRLYQALINLFLKRDVSVLEVLHVECEGMTEPYRSIEIPQSEPVDDSAEKELVVEVQALKEENERLSTELGVTMDTMGTMLNEYASMYAGGASKATGKEKLPESIGASGHKVQTSEPALVGSVESSEPDPDAAKTVASDDMAGEKKGAAEPDQDDAGMFDDAIDIDIGEAPGDETVDIDGVEDLTVLDDETLVIEVNDDDLIELDGDDLDLETASVDGNQVKRAGET